MNRALTALALTASLMGGTTAVAVATASPASAEHAPECFDGSPLMRIGSSGTCVTKVQRALREMGYTLTADGKYGQQTYDRVWRFQRAYGLKPDGIVGPQTGQMLLYCTTNGCA